jgi:hypothetical protein
MAFHGWLNGHHEEPGIVVDDRRTRRRVPQADSPHADHLCAGVVGSRTTHDPRALLQMRWARSSNEKEAR